MRVFLMKMDKLLKTACGCLVRASSDNYFAILFEPILQFLKNDL